MTIPYLWEEAPIIKEAVQKCLGHVLEHSQHNTTQLIERLRELCQYRIALIFCRSKFSRIALFLTISLKKFREYAIELLEAGDGAKCQIFC